MNSYRSIQQTGSLQSNSDQTDIRTSPVTARRREQTLDDLTPAPAPAPRPAREEPFELGRYETKAGETRGLYGIRIDGKPRIIDAAAEGQGRTYTVEEDLHEKGGNGEVRALVADYIAQAGQLGQIPMASSNPSH